MKANKVDHRATRPMNGFLSPGVYPSVSPPPTVHLGVERGSGQSLGRGRISESATCIPYIVRQIYSTLRYTLLVDPSCKAPSLWERDRDSCERSSAAATEAYYIIIFLLS